MGVVASVTSRMNEDSGQWPRDEIESRFPRALGYSERLRAKLCHCCGWAVTPLPGPP